MNYSKIYHDFIVSRREREASIVGYSEKHHILPRSLGGGDEKCNLIRLSPEDHFFAHLLLAKIHGGAMWLAVVLSSAISPFHSGSKVKLQNRHMVGVAKIRATHGANNVLYNSTQYAWRNVDTGAEVLGTLYFMHTTFGNSRPAWTSVLSGNRKSIGGWTLKDRAISTRGLKGKSHSFINKDGRAFTGTQSAFCKKHGVGVASASRMCRHGDVTLCGWRLAGTLDRNPTQTRAGNSIRGGSGEIYTFRKNNIDVVGPRMVLAEKLKCKPGDISAAVYGIRKGIVSSYKGWVLL